MPDSIKVRRATVSDFAELLKLINLAFFKAEDRNFQTVLPHLYADPAVATEQAYLAEVDGKLVGHVGVYPLTLNCGAVTLTAGGIGAVGCHPDYRSRGVMSVLLPEAIRGMEDVGYDISVLWGARTRYRRYGWDDAGRMLQWKLDLKSPAVAAAKPFALRPADPDRDLATLLRLWNADTLGTTQTAASLRRLMLRPDYRFTLSADEQVMAVYFTREAKHAIHKLVGPADQLPGAVLGVWKAVNEQDLHVQCVPGDHHLAGLGRLMGEHLTQYAAAMVRIVRPESLAKKLGCPQSLLSQDGAQQVLFGSPLDLPRPAEWAACPAVPLYMEGPAHV